MSDEQPPPLPPCPKPEKKSRGEIVAWSVVVISVVFLAWTATNPLAAEITEETEGLMSIDEANELAMLKMQSRLIIGISRFQPASAIASINQLEDMATTLRGKVAVAMVLSFVDNEEGRQRGLKILNEIDSTEPESVALKKLVRDAITNGVDEDRKNSLKEQMGWFSGLAKSSGNENESAAREKIMSESVKSMVTMVGFVVLAFFALITGVILLIIFFTLRGSGKAKLHFDPSQSPGIGHVFLESFAIYISIMALGHVLGTYIDERLSMAAYALSFISALMWPKLRGCTWKQFRELIGWNRGKGIFREIGAGILGYLGLIVFALVGLIFTVILISIVNLVQEGTTPGNGAGASHPIVGMLDATEGLAGKLYLLFFAAGLAPFLEETMFRGALFRYLRHNMGFTITAILGGVIFAIIHPQGILALPALSAMGFGFALIREWRDSLIASMTAHALNNGAIVGLLLLVTG